MGSNIENRIFFIIKALDLISKRLNILKISTIYESKPWGVEKQPPFLNCVIKVETDMCPEKLLNFIKEKEKETGRQERFRWGPREIDIDILLYEEEVIETKFLRIPHPFLCQRDFFLYPLIEIEPSAQHPLYKKPISSFINQTENNLKPFCCITYLPLHTFPSFPH